MKNNKISVIIPTYNRGHLIARAVQSVLEQDYRDLEVIIVDDCSTDNTEEVVKSLNDTRVRFIKHTHNKGANAARNTGIKAANGNFIAFQDSDDEWMPGKLSKQVGAFHNTEEDIGVVYTAFFRVEGNQKTYTPSTDVLTTDGFLLEELLKRNFITTQSILVKRECLEEVGLFDETLPRLQDWELLLRLSKHYQFLFIDEALVNVYHTPGSITTNQQALADALVLMLDKHYDDYSQHKEILGNLTCYIGQQFFLSGDLRKALYYCSDALKIQPLNPKFWLILLTFLLGKNLYIKVKSFVVKTVGIFRPKRVQE